MPPLLTRDTEQKGLKFVTNTGYRMAGSHTALGCQDGITQGHHPSPRPAGTPEPPAPSGGKTHRALEAAGAAHGQAARCKFFHPDGNS